MDTRIAAVSLRNVTKTFGAVVANEKVNLDIYKGEILALLGENGSGKTTLMNMLSGIYFPDEGQIFINGKEEIIKSPKDALKLGIGMVHQHFKLVDVLSATENIVLGLEGKLNIKEASGKIAHICEKYGFEVDPKQKIYDMSVSQKQTVEIVKVLYRGADILILDEPTAVLTPQETEKLFRVLRKMRDDGKAIVIITHKMNEVKSLSDRVAVLRGGRYIGSLVTKDTDVNTMTDMMVGHAVQLNIERPDPVDPKPRIEVEGLTIRNEEGIVKLKDVSFTAKQGEVTALIGPSGGGKSTTAALIDRFFDVTEGSILIGGVDIRDIPKEELNKMIAYVFQDNKLLKMSIKDNLKLAKSNATDYEINNALHLAQCDDIIAKLPAGVDTMLGTKGVYLSGGERQRIAIARAILKDSPIVILDEATAFADPENEALVQKAFTQIGKNKTVIMIAHRLSTVKDADIIYVLQNGRVSERGTHNELVAKEETQDNYRHMWNEYQKSIAWKVV